ncbi:SDR family oxidoreductase [Micromonospora sp. KC606]|uniref:SDR family oxidoreductase n=1 Tax=Micromonospora sp. KC606 TaxID=2530379 RepID=UPI00104872A5|nr:SDR family oxidoreductase [Micromonospora sp. KC606]TDC83976.1 SDR family oxidoreductase [Micromonospora sp. KC606]
MSSIVITGAARDFGRSAAIHFAGLGYEVFLSARDLGAARRTRDLIRERGHEQVHAFRCDLTEPASIRDFADQVAERTDGVDVLLNNGAGWLEGADLADADDQEIIDTVTSGGAGTVLMVKYFLPLLVRSERPDIVNLISAAALPNFHGCTGHPAFYAAKGAQAAFTGTLAHRLRPQGVRVISLYPPDFDNIDPTTPEWTTASRTAKDRLTAQSLLACITFAVGQPRDCFIREFHFEPA